MSGRAANGISDTAERRFHALFGVSPRVVNDVWCMCDFKNKTKPQHLLMGLLLNKVYASEETLSSIAGCDRKTFRKWSWCCLDNVSDEKSNVVSVRSLLSMDLIFGATANCLNL